MEQGILYSFSPEFFSDVKSIQEFCQSLIPEINKEITIEMKKKKANIYVNLLNYVLNNIDNEEGEYICILSQCNLLHFIFYPGGDSALLLQIFEKLKKIKSEKLNKPHSWAFHYTLGVSLFDYYRILKDESFHYSIDNLEILFKAKRHFSILLEEWFKGQLDISGLNTQNLFFNWSLTIAELNRWVEPLFILEKIEKKSPGFIENTSSVKAMILDSYMEKTCCSIGALLPYKIIGLVKISLSNKNKENPNLEILNSIKEKAETLLIESSFQPDSLQKLVSEAEIEFQGRNAYQKYIISQNLILNEHSLYCNCKNAAKDDLKIKTNHRHTQIDWVNQFQLLLDQLKHSFDKARQSFFRATQKKGANALCKNTVKNQQNDKSIILSAKAIQLVDAFKECFSILDKIALGFDLAFGLNSKNIHFVTYFKKEEVRSMIESEDNNLYMIALYTIAQDLDKKSDYCAFPEFKDWRNAAEHDFLIPVDSDADIQMLIEKYPIVRCFVSYNELENKTFYMLQLCRSAIFSFAFLIRKASIVQSKKTNQV